MPTPPSCREAAIAPRRRDRAGGRSAAMAAASRRPPRGTNRSLYTDDNPLGAVPFAAKVKLLAEIDAYARGQGPARAPGHGLALRRLAGGADPARRTAARVADIRPLVRLNVAVVVGEGDRMETGSYGAGGRVAYDRLSRPGELAGRRSTRRCARRWSISARCRRRPAR